MPFVHKFALTYKSQENIFYAENTGRRPHGKSCNHIPAVSYSQSKTFAYKNIWMLQIAIQNGHLCHVRRSVCDIIGGQPKTN